MEREIISIEKAKNLASGYAFAFIRNLSDVYIGENVKPVNWNELIEARFFNGESELHFFTVDGELRASKTSDAGECKSIDRRWKMEERFGKSITVRQYLGFDEDGQCFVKQSRLMDWEGSDRRG